MAVPGEGDSRGAIVWYYGDSTIASHYLSGSYAVKITFLPAYEYQKLILNGSAQSGGIDYLGVKTVGPAKE